jgi:hypothetical protein
VLSNPTYNPYEITPRCQAIIKDQCESGTATLDGEEVSLKNIYKGDTELCETNSKLFKERPLHCQPNNHHLICQKLQTIQEESNVPDDKKISYDQCIKSNGKKHIVNNMARCLNKNINNVAEFNNCLKKEYLKTHYLSNEFYSLNDLKWN